MSPVDGPGDRAEDRFPRVSGDEPGHEGNADAVEGFSPRERG